MSTAVNAITILAFFIALGIVSFVIGFTIKNELKVLPKMIRYSYIPCIFVILYGIAVIF